MASEISVERGQKLIDISSDLSNKSFLISPTSQKTLLMVTFDLQNIYKHILRKDRRQRLKDLIKLNTQLNNSRYIVRRFIGKGSFGSVVEALDTVTGLHVAIKIVRLKLGMTLHSNNEVLNLTKANLSDSEGEFFVKMIESFEQNGFLCIVLELLQRTLYQILVEVKRLSLNEIFPIAQDLFKGLQILNESRIIHCDLKPENIMARGSSKQMKIIDFGSSCEIGKIIYKFVQSRFYRAPEVALRLKYGSEIDMWSAGCILSELYTGSPLFESKSETSQMSKTVSLLGPLPKSLVEHSVYYNKYANLTRLELNYNGSLKSYLYSFKGDDGDNPAMLDKFIDLISLCLTYDPASRLIPSEALNHAFFERKASKSLEKSMVVPWPTLPYTTIFLPHKPKSKPKVSTTSFRSTSNFQDTSPSLKNSTAVSRSSLRVSSDEDICPIERPGSYSQAKNDII